MGSGRRGRLTPVQKLHLNFPAASAKLTTLDPKNAITVT